SGATFYPKLSDPEFDLVWCRLQQMCRNLLHLIFQVLHRKIYCCSSNRSAAASKGTDACGDACGVTMQRDNIVRFDPEFIRYNLRECCFLSLPVGRCSSQDGDFARAFDADGTGFPATPG